MSQLGKKLIQAVREGHSNPYRVLDKLGRWTGYWRWYDETGEVSTIRYRRYDEALRHLMEHMRYIDQRYTNQKRPRTLWERLKAKAQELWNDTRG